MKISVHPDYENDSIYVAFSDDAFQEGKVAKTVRVSECISIDLGPDEELIGIDVLSASATVGSLSDLAVDTLIGVKEASELLGVKRPNFIRDFADRPDFPRPVAELATGRIWLKSQVEAYSKDRRRSRRKRVQVPAVSEILADLLTSDELSIRHGALAYYRSNLLLSEPHPPSIEDILAGSLEEDERAILKGQGDAESYIEAAYWIYTKYSEALKSYLCRFVSVDRAEEIKRDSFVLTLRAMQQGSIDLREQPLTRWLLSTAQSLLPDGVAPDTAQPARGLSDPLETLVKAKLYQAAMTDYEQSRAQLQNEAFVLHYLSEWTADEFVPASHSPEEALASARAQIDFRNRLAKVNKQLGSI